MRRRHTFGSILRGVVCLMKDLMTPARPSVLGVIISIWFFCTAWRKDLMWGLIACRSRSRIITPKLGKRLSTTQAQNHEWTVKGPTLWLFLGGENLLVGLSSAASGALRLVLWRDLDKR